MKKLTLTCCLAVTVFTGIGQTNVFPTSGNVGIGTASPAAKLHVSGANLIQQPNGTIVLSRYWQNNTNTRASALFHYYGESLDKLAIAVSGGGGTNFLAPTDSAHVKMVVEANGNVGIGIFKPSERLSVNGNIRAKQIKVEAANWPDYVFDSTYQVIPLEDLSAFIKKNKHLPEVSPANEVEKNGLDLGSNQAILLKKIEELTLYLIELNKTVTELKTTNNVLITEIKQLKQTKNHTH